MSDGFEQVFDVADVVGDALLQVRERGRGEVIVDIRGVGLRVCRQFPTG